MEGTRHDTGAPGTRQRRGCHPRRHPQCGSARPLGNGERQSGKPADCMIAESDARRGRAADDFRHQDRSESGWTGPAIEASGPSSIGFVRGEQSLSRGERRLVSGDNQRTGVGSRKSNPLVQPAFLGSFGSPPQPRERHGRSRRASSGARRVRAHNVSPAAVTSLRSRAPLRRLAAARALELVMAGDPRWGRGTAPS
jgi:hypothetical protein